MKAFWTKLCLSLVLACSYFSSSNAQDVQTTNNLVQPYGWQGCLTQYQGWIWAGTSGGPCPVQRSGDGAILFSYGQYTLSQSIAVNQALSGTGIQVRGYQYGWSIKNANAGGNQAQPYDPLTINVSLLDSNQKELESKTYDYSYRINDWTRFSGTEDYKNLYSLANLGNLRITMTSRDQGFWAGYYGPEIHNVDVRLRYSIDICASNPLSSPSCSGYAEAYKAQQCTANPLYDSSCPGYAEAFKTQKCAANALYDASCPGYAVAYFNQQCSLNPLFANTCPGYAAAYLNQQCTANTLYSQECPGYAAAYLNQQCTANPLYSKECPGYAQAYFNLQCTTSALYSQECPGYAQAFLDRQCTANSLYSQECPGYAQAFFSQQCTANPLYSQECPGYATAYFNNQCSLNPLFNNKCVGYTEAFFSQQCAANPLYNAQCPGYQQAFFAQQCTANPLYNIGCPGYQQAFFAQQCTANSLYNPNCPGYQQAYLNQQCSLNTLYSPQCPGYAEAYRNKLVADTCQANPQSSPQCPGYRTVTNSNIQSASAPVTVVQDPVKSVSEPQLVADPVVNQLVTNNSNTVPGSTPGSTPGSSGSSSPALGTGLIVPGLSLTPPRSSPAARAREQARSSGLQTAARAEQGVRDAQAQQQESIMESMSTVPGFDAYTSAKIPDAQFYVTKEIYRNVTLPDNRRAQRALSERSDRIHREMVDSQYNNTGRLGESQ